MAQSHSSVVLYQTNIGILATAIRMPTQAEWHKTSGASSGSYAAELVERLYNFLIGRSVDLLNEYDQYYRPEYATANEFLSRKYCISPKCLKVLQPIINKNGFIGFVKKYYDNDYQLVWLRDGYEMIFEELMRTVNASWGDSCDED